jgi:pimeloyl-ACP methyl ester carboxylesterase
LANAGFDVWAINFRGGQHSRNHVELDPDTDQEFWEYNLQSGIEDYRATIEFILQQTEYSTVSVVGLSHGATEMIVAASEEPDWFSSRVNVIVALSPVMRLEGLTHAIFNILFDLDTVNLMQNLGLSELVQNSCRVCPFEDNQNWAGACPMFTRICRLFVGIGARVNGLNDDYLEGVDSLSGFNMLMDHLLMGGSLRINQHYAQIRSTSKLHSYSLTNF